MGTKKSVNWTIDVELLRQAKHRAVDEDTSLSALVEKALRKYLK